MCGWVCLPWYIRMSEVNSVELSSPPSLHSLGSGRVQAFETNVFTQLCCYSQEAIKLCIVYKVIYLKVFSVAEGNSLSIKGTSWSCKRPGLVLNTHGATQLPLTVASGNSALSSGLCQLLDECGAHKLIQVHTHV